MSTKAVAWALEQDVASPAAKLVLVGIAEHADRNTWVAWPSRTTCSVYAGCTPRSVTTHFGSLVDAGLVAEVPKAELDTHPDLVDRYGAIPPDKRPRLWLVDPLGAGGNAFYGRVENQGGAGGKPGGNGFHQTKTKPSVKTAVSTVPSPEETQATLNDYRDTTDKTDPLDAIKKARGKA